MAFEKPRPLQAMPLGLLIFLRRRAGIGGCGMSGEKITQEELHELFGDRMPVEVVDLVFNGSGEQTLGELREKIRDLANRTNQERIEALTKENESLKDAIEELLSALQSDTVQASLMHNDNAWDKVCNSYQKARLVLSADFLTDLARSQPS